MQTDDTLIVADEEIHALEEEQLKEANFKAKPKEILTPDNPLCFNGCTLGIVGDKLYLSQKEQGKKLRLVP